jgi:hypothetical protein
MLTVLLICVSSFQDENVKACLPLEYTAEDYSRKDVE